MSNIELSEQEVELFKWFRQYQHIWDRVRKELKPGSLVLHFDKQGKIKKKEFHAYESEESS